MDQRSRSHEGEPGEFTVPKSARGRRRSGRRVSSPARAYFAGEVRTKTVETVIAPLSKSSNGPGLPARDDRDRVIVIDRGSSGPCSVSPRFPRVLRRGAVRRAGGGRAGRAGGGGGGRGGGGRPAAGGPGGGPRM